MQNNLLLHEQFHFIDWIFLIFSHFSVLENKEKATPILYKVSDYVLAMSSTCYVLGETLWMHHFDYHETLMKNASEHFSVLITRFTMVVYLYNVKYFFVVEKKRGPRRLWAIKLEKKKNKKKRMNIWLGKKNHTKNRGAGAGAGGFIVA